VVQVDGYNAVLAVDYGQRLPKINGQTRGDIDYQHLKTANTTTLAETAPVAVRVAVIKTDIALHGNPISELQDVTCHMRSHSVTCHPTQVNAPRLTPAMQAGTRFTYPGGVEG